MPVPDDCKISVIICTHNREQYLCANLQSLANQSIDKGSFEIVLIDDGSTDGTRQVVDSFSHQLPVRYFYQNNSGLSSAKNHGVFAARSRVVLFFDDDDIATPTFLEEHIMFHEKYTDEKFAVLNHTAWAPNIKVTPLMEYITGGGCFLFSYPLIRNGQILNYTYFWGGRSSCKRSLLLKHGLFRQDIKIHYEDIELGYRLAKNADLKVIYNARAISYMAREVNFDDFCKRMYLQGQSSYLFGKIHDCEEIIRYCELEGMLTRWQKTKPGFYEKMQVTRRLDTYASLKRDAGLGLDGNTKQLLYNAYSWTFRSCKLKGMIYAYEADKTGSKIVR